MGVRISSLTAIAEAVATNDLLALVNVSESSDKTKKVTVAQLLAALGTLGVSSGGTGQTSLTAYNVLLGNGTSAVAFAAPGTSGYPLLSQGASANPAFAQVAEGGQTLSDVTTLDVSTSKHGYCPKAPNDTAKYLRGDATWATLPAGTAYDMLSTLTGAEISITGATTATISRMHVCSGTSADYTVTLPAASGNTGKLIGFRMSTALTKRVTLDGNGSETIDGETTRVMWAAESAILYCDGSNWFKIAGKTRPMHCVLYQSAQLACSNLAYTQLQYNTIIIDTTTMADTANYRIYCRRSGVYQVYAAVTGNGTTTPGSVLTANIPLPYIVFLKNDTNFLGFNRIAAFGGAALNGGYLGITPIFSASLTDGDYVVGGLYQNSGVTIYAQGSSTVGYTTLHLSEVPSW